MSTYEALKYTFTGANLTSIPTSAITSGTFANARISSGSVTQHVSATTEASGTWTPGFQTGSTNSASAKYVKIGKLVFCRTSFYMNNDFTTSGTTLRLTGLPFTAASGNTFAGQGYANGYSNASGNVMVEAGTDTCVFVSSTKNPTLNIDQTNGGQARRYSLDNGPDKWYNLFFTYEASS